MAKFKVKFLLHSGSQPIETEIDAPSIFEAKELINTQYSPYMILRLNKIPESDKSENGKSSSLSSMLKGFLFLLLFLFAIAVKKNHEDSNKHNPDNSHQTINQISPSISSDVQDKLPSSKFADGQTSRREWESWIASLSGDERRGAEYWAGERSKPTPSGCDGTIEFSHGCFEAQRRLSAIDKARHANTDFRNGWNKP
ncbi:hypothetical protein [Komagataeibacter swingsii]|uniref:Uncharacterized protein n=1 Tax=Komagataeibacter swingsii TaxID=215220 RepID=A0A850P9A3_9PROT|nr:hypothetical protein [Komagataeibacter swingsii]NVN38462.1 hypothetical protein [Komagataeibacter swingsii]